jgi:dTDP-4-dehydrorhamnose reductase
MLGSEVSRVATESGLEVIEVSRSSEVPFEAESMDFDQVAVKLGLGDTDWLVNCIGWIPQKSSGDEVADAYLAELLNTSLPGQISRSREKHGFHWIQIGTDCVFDGKSGDYTELSPKNGSDLYGRSKIGGEELSHGAIQIRCSIVGRDVRTHSGIYSWFKSSIREGKVNGYTNHRWNGVTTTAFAHLAVGLVSQNWTQPMNQHWIPKDVVSKYELLQLFAKTLGEKPGAIQKTAANETVDRELGTVNPHLHSQLWTIAGYPQVPTIESLCKEFIKIDRELGFSDEQK